MLMVTPDQLSAIVEEAVSRAVAGHDEALTLREAAKHLKVSTKTIARKVAAGQIVPCSMRPLRIMRSALGGR